ncbi:MAG: SdrD B-like domain-containing protein, partial [Angustibacter sp.]
GNRVWVDDSASGLGNGVQDPGEPGLADVPVRLYAADGTTLIASTTTDSSGGYSFTGLAAGDYVVAVDAPTGYVSTTDRSSTADPDSGVPDDDNGVGTGDGTILSGAVTLTPGSAGAQGENVVTSSTASTRDPTVDFGLVPAVSVGDFVWWDRDKDGIQDAGEPGVPGVTVRLFQADGTTPVTEDVLGNPISPITTDGLGGYDFAALPPGQYVVTFTPPAGWLPSPVGAGSDPALDSNGATATSAALSAGQSDTTLDSGFFPEPGSVGDFAWIDRDGDGIQDVGETGLAGVTVTLFEADGVTPVTQDSDGNPISPIVTTATGAYSFTNLNPGSYVVQFDPPAGWDPTITGQGTAATGSDGLTVPVTVTAGGVNVTIDSGFVRPTVAVGDYVWFDADRDGLQDASESGLGGATVQLFEADGTTPVTQDAFGDPITPIITDPDGAYLFDELLPGQYVVQFTAPPGGYLPTLVSAAGTTSANDSNGLTATSATLPGGEQDLTLDSGFYLPPVSVGDYVWYDEDHDGVQDATESGLAGVTVRLFEADGVTPVTVDAFGGTIAPITTTATGQYLFENLPPGRYVVRFSPPAGYEPTVLGAGTPGTDSNGPTVTSSLLPPGESDLTLDAGFWRPAEFGGLAWIDADADGVRDPSETRRVAGVTVSLLDATGAVVATTTTDSAGAYQFTGLEPGTYSVRFAMPSGLVLTGANVGPDDTVDSDAAPDTGQTSTFTLVPGPNDPDVDAGAIPASEIGGNVYVDANRNGTQDPGEAAIAGVTITLTGTDRFGNPIRRTTTTAADGSYRFTDLPPGTYEIRQTQPAGFVDGPDTAGTSGGTAGSDVIQTIVLGVGEVARAYDFTELRRIGTTPGGGNPGGPGPSTPGAPGEPPAPGTPGAGGKPAAVSPLARTGADFGYLWPLGWFGLASLLAGLGVIGAISAGRWRRRQES